MQGRARQDAINDPQGPDQGLRLRMPRGFQIARTGWCVMNDIVERMARAICRTGIPSAIGGFNPDQLASLKPKEESPSYIAWQAAIDAALKMERREP